MEAALAALRAVETTEGDEGAYRWFLSWQPGIDDTILSAIYDDRLDEVRQAVQRFVDEHR